MDVEKTKAVVPSPGKKIVTKAKKQGKSTPSKVIINPVEKETWQINERFVNLSQRIRRSQQMRRREPILKLKKAVAKFRPKSKEQLKLRSAQIAKSIVRTRFAGQRGANYSALSRATKLDVDRSIEPKSKIIARIATRLLPRVRGADIARLSDVRRGKAKGLNKYLRGGALNQSFDMQAVSDLYDQLTEKDVSSLLKKASNSGIDFNVIREIFARGLSESSKQRAFERVNSYIAHGAAYNLDSDVAEAKKLKGKDPCWDNYKMIGRKPNGDPNCVGPTNEAKTPAWSRKEGKNPEGGLNKKGIASYRRENPGSNLSMAVTTPPSKLDPDSKSAKRRKSFCARMSGVDGPMKKPSGEPTRKALALRKWNC